MRTEGLDFCGTLIDLKGYASLVKKHGQGESSQTTSDDEDLGSLRIHN